MCPLIQPDMVTGVHCCCLQDWMNQNKEELITHYRKDLDYATRMGAEYVVFHVVQVDGEESFTYQMKHTNREVIDAAASFINELLDRQTYHFWFLMENLWWPGLTFENRKMPGHCLNRYITKERLYAGYRTLPAYKSGSSRSRMRPWPACIRCLTITKT
ncbi:MAG: hypothetical protein ACLVAT_12635 [Lachnospiraceae bacterium]